MRMCTTCGRSSATRERRSRPSAASGIASPMADGRQPLRGDDGAEQAVLADEARLIRRARWRFVVWSGVSTLLVLLVLAGVLYAAVARTLETASVAQLRGRIDPLASFLKGDPGGPGAGPD